MSGYWLLVFFGYMPKYFSAEQLPHLNVVTSDNGHLCLNVLRAKRSLHLNVSYKWW